MAVKPASGRDSVSGLNLFFTGKCNLSCEYCFVDKKKLENRVLDENLLKKSVDLFLLYSGNRKVIGFSGGEPMMEKSLLMKACDYARKIARKKKMDLRIAVATNGTLLDKKIMDYLGKIGAEVKISIDGKSLVHDKNRPFKKRLGKSSFQEIIKNVKCLKGKGFGLTASMVFSPLNIDQLLEGIEFLRKSGFSQIDFFPDLFSTWKPAELEKMKKTFNKFAVYYAALFLRGKKTFKNSFLAGLLTPVDFSKAETCEKINFGPDGKAYVCDKVFSLKPSFRRKYLIGSIKDGVNNEKRRKLLEKIRKNFYQESGLECEKCEYFKFCFCPAGHYIISPLAKSSSSDFFKSFCSVAKIYIITFSRLKNALKFNERFIDFYGNKEL